MMGNATVSTAVANGMIATNLTMDKTACYGRCHTSNMTILTMNNTITGIKSVGRLCVCPGSYSYVCPADSSLPALVIDKGQDVTLECVTSNSSNETCIFGCPGVIVHVKSEGKLTLLGNGAMEFSGGQVYSRMVVDAGGIANLTGVSFRE